MEENNQDHLFSDLEFDVMARDTIATMAQWALVIAVIGIVTSVVELAQLFLAPYNMMTNSQEGFSSLVGSSLIASKFFGVIFIGIGLLLHVFLYLFARGSKRSTQAGDGNGIGRSFTHLKSYFMIISIFLIIFFVLAILGMFVGLMGLAVD